MKKWRKRWCRDISQKELFSKISRRKPAGGEEDEQKKQKGQAEEDFTIKVESDGEEKSAVVIDQ